MRLLSVLPFAILLATGLATASNRVLKHTDSKSPTLRYGLRDSNAKFNAASTDTSLPISLAPTTGTTDEETLERYGYFAMAAGRNHTIGGWTCGPICTVPQTADSIATAIVDTSFPEASIHALVVLNPTLKQVIVAFRGTTTDADVLQNMNWALCDWPIFNGNSSSIASVGGGTVQPSVHCGFLDGYSAGADKIYEAATAQLSKYPDYSLVIVGFSLGGAHATITAIDFQLRDASLVNRTSVYTYGSPRMGDADLARYFNSRPFTISARVVANADLVIHLPPQWTNYLHVNREYWLVNDTLHVCSANSTKEDPACSDSVPLTKYNIDDHHYGYWNTNI
ncbi:alpha/beta-hydrolase [Ramicandelaber brevisporus]|nr:alpha/beta-hydrolase [Ramicandelaber brevisporus]